eukprot:Pgem_evm1s1891
MEKNGANPFLKLFINEQNSLERGEHEDNNNNNNDEKTLKEVRKKEEEQIEFNAGSLTLTLILQLCNSLSGCVNSHCWTGLVVWQWLKPVNGK